MIYKIIDLSTGTYVDGFTFYSKEHISFILSQMFYSKQENQYYIKQGNTEFKDVPLDIVKVTPSMFLVEEITQ